MPSISAPTSRASPVVAATALVSRLAAAPVTTSGSMAKVETATSPAIHRPAGQGEALWAMGSLFELKLHSEETDGALTAMEVTQPPGIATPLHVHHREAEVFYVLAGTLDYEAGGQLHQLTAGSLIWLPKGVPHRFRITGNSPARFLGLALPGGLERLYRAVGVPAERRPCPAPTRPSPRSLAGRRPRPPIGSKCSAHHCRHSPPSAWRDHTATAHLDI
jgi:quercetin dioxygenase-like cupin family protein